MSEKGLIERATLDGIADAIRVQAGTDETMQPSEMPDAIRALNVLNGILPVSKGGTGCSTLDSGKALVGAGTGAVEMRAINDSQTIGPLSEYSDSLATTDTMAFWNGAYNEAGTSNLSKLGVVDTGTWKAGAIDAAHGGTGRTSLDSGKALVGAGTGAVEMRAINDNRTIGPLSEFSGSLATTDTLAYWDGRYGEDSSNLRYCDRGRFGTIVTCNSPLPIDNGGTGAQSALQALVNLGVSDADWMDFTASSAADWENQVKAYILSACPSGRPFVFNAGWAGRDYGSGIAWKLAGDVVNVIISNPGAAGGVKFWRCSSGAWSDVMLANESRGIIYSATDPGCVNGRIWLKPIS